MKKKKNHSCRSSLIADCRSRGDEQPVKRSRTSFWDHLQGKPYNNTASVIHTNPRLPLECKKSKKGAVSLSEDDETSGVCDESVAGFDMTHPNSPWENTAPQHTLHNEELKILSAHDTLTHFCMKQEQTGLLRLPAHGDWKGARAHTANLENSLRSGQVCTDFRAEWWYYGLCCYKTQSKTF